MAVRLSKPSRIVLCAVGLAFFSSSGIAQVGLIRDHFDKARKFDPNYIAAVASLDAAEKATAAAQAALGPKVSLSMTTFRTERVEESRTLSGQTVDSSRRFDTQNAVVQARQPLYRKRDSLGLEQAQTQQAAADQILQYAEQDLQTRLLGAWVEVLASRTLVSTYAEALIAAQEILTEVERRRKGGESTVQDLEQARAKVTQAEALLEDARARLSVADQALTLVAGPEAKVPLGVSMGYFSTLPLLLKSETEVVEWVERSNREVAGARLQEEAAMIEREKARSDRLPTVDAFASATKGQNDSLNFIKDEQRVGLQLSVPLYTHGAIDAAVAQADANYRKQQAQTKSVAFRVRNEAVTSFHNIKALGIRIRAADRLAEASAMMSKAMQLGLRAGVNTRSEVSQAMTELLSAQRDRVMVRKEYAMAWVKLQAALGALNFEVLESLESQLMARAPAGKF